MDKNNYETYEYLPVNSVDGDSNQFFVVQDDGTFLSVNRPVQYVTQVQNVKETVDEAEPCDTYNVTPQQFYVDVDNSSELISVSDQFIIPEADSNMYSNSYLLHAVENEKVEEMEEDNVEHYNEVEESIESDFVEENTNAETAENKTNEDCTEITLSDEQYQLLEKKGWILLDIGERVFLLDNSGLHDISDDQKLIEKLKTEFDADSNDEVPSSSVKLENEYIPNTEEEDDLQKVKIKQDIQNCEFIEHGVVEDNENYEETYYENEQEPEIIYKEDDKLNNAGHLTSAQTPHDYVRLKSVKDTSVKRENDSLRIKTKFSFKDIPSQIVLGKTTNGKNLVASVKTERSYNKGRNGNSMKNSEQNSHQSNVGLDEGLFNNLIQEAIVGPGKCSMKDVIAAEIVVDQLLRVPAFRPTVISQRLIITKVIIEELDDTGETFTQTKPTLVTGRVRKSGLKVNFMYMPSMLRKAAEEEENDDLNQRNGYAEDHFLHIHVKEMKSIHGITRISITLNKRQVQLKEDNENFISRQKMVYACSACAAIYNTEEGLRLHQETECMEIDNPITMDAESPNTNTFTTIKSGSDKQYVCNHCDAVFTKLSICQNHIKSHYEEMNVEDDEESTASNSKNIEQQIKVFKCKMCPITFLHAATLSKHIVSKHIQIKAEK